MNSGRDMFSAGVKAVLANRAAFRCSKPDCRALTLSAGASAGDAHVNVGVAAHITAASPGGPRYDSSITPEERSSGANGIWLCQTHAKLIDSDVNTYTSALLRYWKTLAEDDARSMLGRPISGQAIDIHVQISLHRASNESLVVAGTVNLPDGAKLFAMLYEDDGVKTLGQVRAIVRNGIFAAGGFTKNGTAHCHDWYQVEVLAYFNGPWQQPSEVMAVVGTDGVNLAGRFSEAVHPDVDDSSEQVLRARFKVIAPVLTNTPSLTDAQLKSAIELTKGARLTIGGRLSGETIEGGIALLFRSGALRAKDGWAAAERADGSVRVEYSFWNGTEPAVARWVVLLEPVRVNCMNVYAKYFSDVPND